MSLKKGPPENSQQLYIARLIRLGFLPPLSAEKQDQLKSKLDKVDEKVLPIAPLSEGGKPTRGSWSQLFGQGNAWRNSSVCKNEETNTQENGDAPAPTVGFRR